MEPDGRPTPRLILVGREQAIAEGDTDAVLSFYGGLFERLPAEARQVSASPRFIGYRNYGDDGITRHFFGIEADAIESIPAGMIAWEVDGAVRTVWRSDGSRERVVSRDAIRWQWLEQCGLRAIGEFGVRLSADECGSGPGFRNYVLSCVSAAASNRSSGIDDVDLVEYDPRWPERYQEFEARLREMLGTDIARRIEHYGSTAIPGMPAKPVIDVLVEVPDFAQAKRALRQHGHSRHAGEAGDRRAGRSAGFRPGEASGRSFAEQRRMGILVVFRAYGVHRARRLRAAHAPRAHGAGRA